MVKKNKTREKKNGIAIAVTVTLCTAITLSRFVASFFPAKRLWGVSHLGYFPMSVRIGVTLAALAILVPWINRKIRAFLKVILVWVEEHLLRAPWKLGYIALGAAAGLCFFLLRQKTYLLGDGRLLLIILDNGNYHRGAVGELLGIWVPFNLSHLLSSFHVKPVDSYAIVSCSAGVLFLFFALIWGKIADGEDLLGRWVGFGVLMTMGIVQQFFGYVENYSLLLAAQLAYFIVGLQALKCRMSLFYATLLLGVLISLHLTSLMLIPSWILLLVETRKSWSKSKKLVIFFLGILGTFLLTGLAIQRIGAPGSLTRYAIPLSSGTSEAPEYTLFSGAHWIDFINLISLASPVALPLLLLAFWFFKVSRGKEPKIIFLLLAALAQVSFLFLFNPGLGAGRDWDLLSATGTIAFTLLLTYTVIKVPLASRGYLGLALVWTGFFSSATFIALNASEKASVQRAEDMTLLDPLRARSDGVMTVVEYYQEHHMTQTEHQFEKRALERVEPLLEEYPENAMGHLLRAAILLNYSGNVIEAQKDCQIALEREPNLSLAWDILGSTYIAQRQPEKAIFCYEHHLTLNPRYAYVWDQLAMLYNVTGQLDQEIRCLEQLTQLTPNKIRVWGSLGLALEAKEDYKGAESAFRRAIRLNPKEPMLHSDLGRDLLFQGKWTEAEAECRETIHLNPISAEAYSNLGTALNQMGKYAEAESSLREGLAIDPNIPEMHLNLSFALQGQGKNEEAKAEYEAYTHLIGNRMESKSSR